jgi:Tol biopolymer transport system component
MEPPAALASQVRGDFVADEDGWIWGSPAADRTGCPSATGLRRLEPSFELWSWTASDEKARVHAQPGFQAFPDTSPDGSQVVYVGVSSDSKDPELWVAERGRLDDPRRLTRARGMDSRPRFSSDGNHLYWSASRPRGADQLRSWAQFEKDGSVPPLNSEIWATAVEDSEGHALTQLEANSFAPVPFAKGIIFTSNAHDPRREDFDLYYLALDGPKSARGLPLRITHAPGFDGMAAALPDGRLAFVSERSGDGPQLMLTRVELPDPS